MACVVKEHAGELGGRGAREKGRQVRKKVGELRLEICDDAAQIPLASSISPLQPTTWAHPVSKRVCTFQMNSSTANPSDFTQLHSSAVSFHGVKSDTKNDEGLREPHGEPLSGLWLIRGSACRAPS